ncbi:hypothetical protein ACO0M4_16535 [Streptomyces sp. RGM 3693]
MGGHHSVAPPRMQAAPSASNWRVQRGGGQRLLGVVVAVSCEAR